MIISSIKFIIRAVLYGLAGMLLLGSILLIHHLQGLPELEPWHKTELQDFSHSNDDIRDLPAYLQLEDALFRQVKEQVYLATDNPEGNQYNRYVSGSRSDPMHYRVNWNRTFELRTDKPVATVLMLHGMSDSPYSMRAIARLMHEKGAHVLALRLPGHGTLPSGLEHVSWRDFTAAVRLGARHLQQIADDGVPFYIAGFSNGGALAVDYALESMESHDLPRPDGLLLLSPALGVSPLASLASITLYLSRIPGLEKMAWLAIQPEYDPYKYNSFAINAGEQVYRLTEDIARRIDRLDKGKGVGNFPPVLAFKSAVDATVPPDTLVSGLFDRLAPNHHHLVFYDVNRQSDTDELLISDPAPLTKQLLDSTLNYDFTLLTNRNSESREVVARQKDAFSAAITQQSTGLAWPQSVYSSSHVALPFSPHDPIYGSTNLHSAEHVSLGSLQLHGERSLLVVPISQLMRLRYNPFFDYQMQLILDRFLPE